MKRVLRRILAGTAIVGTLALLGCTASASGSHSDPQLSNEDLSTSVTKKLDAAVKTAMTKAGASGAIVGVWAPWSGSWVSALGTTEPKGSQPMKTTMPFRIASNTKSMTCTVLLALADRGTVALDDPVKKYLPRMVGIDGITLHQLCQNTSGIGDYEPSLQTQFVNNPTREWVPLELVSNGLAQESTGAPGQNWAYSNTGFVLLGMALEAATDKSWQALYEQYIFDPLDLSDTYLPGEDKVELPGASPHGYAAALDNAGKPICTDVLDESELSPSMGWTAGGVVSTLNDLKVYVQALATGSLLPQSSYAAQWKLQTLSDDAPKWQGYGMGVIQLGPLRGHDGEIPGFISAMMSDPDSGLTVVVMLNNSTNGGEIAQKLGMQLAAIAAKAPATSGNKAPKIDLPWDAAEAAKSLDDSVVCTPENFTPTPTPTADSKS